MNQQNKSDALEILIILAMFLLVLVVMCWLSGKKKHIMKRKVVTGCKI